MKTFRLHAALAAFLLIGCYAALAASAQGEIALSIYVHEGNLNGTMLSDVRITGQDAEGNSRYLRSRLHLLTVYVYEESLNGTELSGVQITGRDAAGSEISAITDAEGAAAIGGSRIMGIELSQSRL